MALANTNYYTIEDIYALPEGQRAELIDGQIYDMAPPNRLQIAEHNKVSTENQLKIKKTEAKISEAKEKLKLEKKNNKK